MSIKILSNVKNVDLYAKNIGINAECSFIDKNFTLKRKESPSRFVERILTEEAQMLQHNEIISIKTVFVGRRLIQQPQNPQEAEKLLKLYSGRNHLVICGVCALNSEGRLIMKKTITRVKIKVLSLNDIKTFVDTNQWQGIGGYDPNGYFLRFIKKITGSNTGFVGFPCYEVNNISVAIVQKI